jgi:hypothetical protein
MFSRRAFTGAFTGLSRESRLYKSTDMNFFNFLRANGKLRETLLESQVKKSLNINNRHSRTKPIDCTSEASSGGRAGRR